jgi:hypothetical protein
VAELSGQKVVLVSVSNLQNCPHHLEQSEHDIVHLTIPGWIASPENLSYIYVPIHVLRTPAPGRGRGGGVQCCGRLIGNKDICCVKKKKTYLTWSTGYKRKTWATTVCLVTLLFFLNSSTVLSPYPTKLLVRVGTTCMVRSSHVRTVSWERLAANIFKKINIKLNWIVVPLVLNNL